MICPGLCYLAAGFSNAGPAVWLVFAVEKLAYFLGWLRFMNAPPPHFNVAATLQALGQPAQLLEALPAIFHCGYGPMDGVWMLLFLHQALKGNGQKGRGTTKQE